MTVPLAALEALERQVLRWLVDEDHIVALKFAEQYMGLETDDAERLVREMMEDVCES